MQPFWVLLISTELFQMVLLDAQYHKFIRPFRRRRIQPFEATKDIQKKGGAHKDEQKDITDTIKDLVNL